MHGEEIEITIKIGRCERMHEGMYRDIHVPRIGEWEGSKVGGDSPCDPWGLLWVGRSYDELGSQPRLGIVLH